MNDKRTNESPLLFIKDSLIGENVKRSLKTLADLRGVFHNCEAYEQMSPDTLLYEVTCHLPVEEGTPGGLYFGITRIYPGKVGDEYFMTKGHFHANMNRGEYYWGVEGEGRLIMMDQNRRVWSERMFRKRLLNYILCIRFFIEVHSIVSASRFFHMPTYLRVVIECQSRFFPFFPAFSRNCPDYFLHTSGSSSFRSLSDLGAR